MNTILSLLLGCTNDFTLTDVSVNLNADVHNNSSLVKEYNQEWRQLMELSDLDIVISIDKSGSMSDDRERVYQGLFNLVDLVDANTNSWVIHPISTDYYPRLGAKISSDQFWSYNSIRMEIDALVGSGEAGLASTYNYVKDSYGTPNRDLLILIISDEQDHSGAIIPSEWAQFQKDRASFYNYRMDAVSIVNFPDSQCLDYSGNLFPVSQEDWGTRYLEAMDALDGGKINLCENGWESFLSEYSFLTSLKDYATLDHIPLNPNEIVITVNGNNFNDWTYEYPKTIHWTIIPQMEDEIVISYKYVSGF